MKSLAYNFLNALYGYVWGLIEAQGLHPFDCYPYWCNNGFMVYPDHSKHTLFQTALFKAYQVLSKSLSLLDDPVISDFDADAEDIII